MYMTAENVCKIWYCYLQCAAMQIVYRFNLQSKEWVRRFLMLRPLLSLCIVGMLVSYIIFPEKRDNCKFDVLSVNNCVTFPGIDFLIQQ
jgi:hypothetical protein